MKKVDLYFDFSCPWSYLTLLRLRDVVERNAATIVFKPVSVDLILATENPGLQQTRLADNPAKAAWQQADLHRWATTWGLTLNLPGNWPFDGTLAGAGMQVAMQAGKGMDYALAVFTACFSAAEDISQADVLVQLAVGLGLEADEFRLGLNATNAVRDNSLELLKRGGFGTPSMFVGEELFFGNDRVSLVEWTLSPLRDVEFVMPGQHNTY